MYVYKYDGESAQADRSAIEVDVAIKVVEIYARTMYKY